MEIVREAFMPDAVLAIGDLAAGTGVSAQTVRYYEDAGLMPRPARTEGGQRRYTRADLDRLSFIRHARDLGFPLSDVRRLLALADHPDDSCADAHRLAAANLAAVRKRLAQLAALEAELSRIAAASDEGHVRGCRVIEVLADHGRCLHADHGGGHTRDLSTGATVGWTTESGAGGS